LTSNPFADSQEDADRVYNILTNEFPTKEEQVCIRLVLAGIMHIDRELKPYNIPDRIMWRTIQVIAEDMFQHIEKENKKNA
jgi:hypothetical protein